MTANDDTAELDQRSLGLQGRNGASQLVLRRITSRGLTLWE